MPLGSGHGFRADSDAQVAITIDAGTTAPTAVLVEGNDIDANLQQIFIYEQTSAGAINRHQLYTFSEA